VREITLLGQIVTSYGRRDYVHTGGRSPFVQLLERVHAIEGHRAHPLHLAAPARLQGGPGGGLRRLPKLCGTCTCRCRAGSNRILRAMNRPYSRERYQEIVDALRGGAAGHVFSTDVIVGFPGRDGGGFRADARAVRGVQLRHGLHLQVLGPHRHAGGGDGGQVPEEVKEERNQILLEAFRRNSLRRTRAGGHGGGGAGGGARQDRPRGSPAARAATGFIGFGVVAALAFVYVPDFLAVRGLAALVLLSATPLLGAAYMEYHHPQRLLMVSLVYVAIALALWLGASPFRLRDFLGWLFATPGRPRALGVGLLGYGLILTVVAFTY
jgi:hypothetical protein